MAMGRRFSPACRGGPSHRECVLCSANYFVAVVGMVCRFGFASSAFGRWTVSTPSLIGECVSNSDSSGNGQSS